MWKFIRSVFDTDTSEMSTEEKVLSVLKKYGDMGTPLPKLIEVCPASYRTAITRLRKNGHDIVCVPQQVRKNGVFFENHTVYFYLGKHGG